MVVEFDPFVKEFGAFPDEYFGDQIANRLGFNMIAQKFDVVFVWFKNKVEKL